MILAEGVNNCIISENKINDNANDGINLTSNNCSINGNNINYYIVLIVMIKKETFYAILKIKEERKQNTRNTEILYYN